ncbi:tetratricopeptide repeat-containing sensor histidine kinase [Mucilaginibacter sp. CSA2-8R]|uniref:tetratricopeptide repeat-containing sensor histidine kinase n=1 Tax=Mucilaginibacter sp. CSA2-8R TaxID=3141542 RepID=UPI00315D87DF
MPLLIKRSTIFLSLLLCLTYSYTAVAVIKQSSSAQSSSLTIADYEKLIKQYRYSKPDSAVFFAKMGLAEARKKKDLKGQAMMLNQLGMIDDNLGDFDASNLKYTEALELYRRGKNPVGEAAIIVRLGVVELRKGNYDKAIDLFIQSLKVAERSKNAAGCMEAYLTLAEGYMGQRKFDTALKYLHTAEKINNTIPFSNLSLNIYNNFGVVYREMGIPTLAKTYLEKGIMLSGEPQYQGLNITLTNNLAKVYNKQGNKAKSISLQIAALQKARAINNYLRELQTLTGLADTYGASDAPKALYYFNQALTLVREKGARKQEIEILSRLADLYKYQHNYQLALKLREQQNTLADSLYYKAMAKQVTGLQTEYQLYKSKARVRELDILYKQQRLQRNVYITLAFGALAVLLVIGYYFYRTRRLNKLLNTANTNLKESNQVKDKLFSVLAHDLRAPLASVIDLLFLLDDDDIEGEEKTMLIKRLTSASNITLETLNMLLKWGEMQLKGVRLNSLIVQPAPIIERIINLLTETAEKKKIQLISRVNHKLTMLVDPNHFEFVMRNVTANAVKFTPTGGWVNIDAIADINNNLITFSVQDNGIGIGPDRLPYVFDIGSASTKGTNNETGTSLGLVICKEFIEINQGKIWAESKNGQGTTFFFSLPMFQGAAIKKPVLLPAPRKAIRLSRKHQS